MLINDSSNKLETSSRSSNGSEYKNGVRAVSINDDNQSIPSLNIEKVDFTLDMKPAKNAEANLKLTTDDFEFLEKMGTSSITTANSSLTSSLVVKRDDIMGNDNESVTSSKKSKSKKKSKDSDTETKKKKKSSKKDSDDDEAKSKKKSKEKRRSKKQERDESGGDDDEGAARVHVKADLDYEEI